MRTSLHPLRTLRGFFLVSLVALSPMAGCGKPRTLFTPTPKESDNPHSVTISWTASISPVAGYNVYRAAPPGAPVKLTTTRIVSGTQYTDRTVEAGHSYTYSVTSVNFNGTESVPSANITVTVPATVTPTSKQ